MRTRRILVMRGLSCTTYHDYDQLWRILRVTHHRGSKREIIDRRNYMVGETRR